MLKVIGGEQEGEFKAVASGTLPNGKPVVVNADGTVSVAAETSGTESIGTEVQFESGGMRSNASVYDTTNNRIVIAYRDDGNLNKGTAIVGTVGDNTITFGTPVVFDTDNANHTSIAYDSANSKVIIAYRDNGNSGYGTAIVGTVSGTSISFGTAVVFESAGIEQTSSAFDVNAGKVVIAYRDDGNSTSGTAVVGTVSGTSISFGTPVVFNSGSSGDYSAVYNPNAQNIIIAYRRGSDTSGQAVVGTVSGTSISFGSTNEFTTNNLNYVEAAYDTNSSTIVITYQDSIQSSYLYVVAGSPSGNSITFGTPVVVNSASTIYPWIAYHAAAKKVVISYIDEALGNNYLKFRVATVSGTSVTLATASTLVEASSTFNNLVYDPDTVQMVANFRDVGDSNKGKAIVFKINYTATNLTAENYIGMSRGVVDAANQSQGSYTVFESASTSHVAAAYDSNNEKVVFAYADAGNSSYGTAVVGTISGTTISFGTPVIFESGNTRATSATFDSTNNKIVIVYRDNSNSDQGTAIVGEVSGNSISFGTAVIFNDNYARNTMQVVFDSTNDKVVIAYSDNSFNGRGIVGTISGTSISFGSSAIFQSASGGLGVDYVGACFDSTNGKVVVSYRDALNNTRATAAVGTVSGTSISFGSDVEVSTESGATYVVPVFDPTEGKVVVYFNVGTSGNRGRACVGTVSGTTITFGSENIYYDSGTQSANNKSAVYDTKAGKIVLGFQIGGLNYGALVAGKVSGNTITFDDVFTFSTDAISQIALAYDSVNEKVAVGIRDAGNNNYGTGFVFTVGYDNRGTYANDGDKVSFDIIGTVNSSQFDLTAGEKYYVQTDGTISTTAGSPSVLAGTAISATKLVVKT